MVRIDGFTHNDLISVARSGGQTVDGGDFYAKRDAAAILKHRDFYFTMYGKPETRKQWREMVDWCIKRGF